MVALARMRSISRFEPNERPLRIDRRVFGRAPAHVRVEARRLANTLAALRSPVVDLHVRDISLGGLSALTEHRIEEGEPLEVYLPSVNGMPPWDAYGRVVRCELSPVGYRVAVEFEPRPAA